MHRGLAEMYVADPGFAAHYDERAPGLAIYVHDAIVASTATTGERAKGEAISSSGGRRRRWTSSLGPMTGSGRGRSVAA